jgi:hypothetical protein
MELWLKISNEVLLAGWLPWLWITVLDPNSAFLHFVIVALVIFVPAIVSFLIIFTMFVISMC